MKRFFVSELYPNARYQAGTLREDIETILREEGYVLLKLPNSTGFIGKLNLYLSVITLLFQIPSKSCCFFHFPLRSRAIRVLQAGLRFKRVNSIAFIHDLDGIRDQSDKLKTRDIRQLDSFTILIAQTEVMKVWVQSNTGHTKILVLGMYDYLSDMRPRICTDKNEGVAFAGNLKKAPFVHFLGKITGINWFIYGDGQKLDSSPNIHTMGTVDPRKLPARIRGSFGLIWDGDEIGNCTGQGAYLKYNIPHKAALYLRSGLPVIVWKQSGIAEWVTETKTGILIDHIEQTEELIHNTSNETYQAMAANCRKIAGKMQEKYFIKKTIQAWESVLGK